MNGDKEISFNFLHHKHFVTRMLSLSAAAAASLFAQTSTIDLNGNVVVVLIY